METVLRVEDLTIGSVSGGSETKIVSGVSFSLKAGQVIGLIGESGSGKTTIGLSSLGFFKPGLRARGGRVMLGDTDLLKLNEPKLRALRGKEVAYVAQSAAAAFNPCIVIDEQVIEPLTEHGLAEGQAVRLLPSHLSLFESRQAATTAGEAGSARYCRSAQNVVNTFQSDRRARCVLAGALSA